MAFNPNTYDIEIWLRDEASNLLQKQCIIRDTQGRITDQYETRIHISPIGTYNYKGQISTTAPCLYRKFTYDADGNKTALVPVMAEWTQACEDGASGGSGGGSGGFTNGIPVGLLLSKSDIKYGEISIPVNVTSIVKSITLNANEVAYIRYINSSSDSVGEFTYRINGLPIGKNRISYTEYNVSARFDTADGGVKMVGGDTLEVEAFNCGESLGVFNSTVVLVYE